MPEYARLARDPDHAMLAGVCAGLARFIGWNRTLVRVLFVLISVFSAAFPGIIVYLVLMLLMPRHRTPGTPGSPGSPENPGSHATH